MHSLRETFVHSYYQEKRSGAKPRTLNFSTRNDLPFNHHTHFAEFIDALIHALGCIHGF